MKRFLAVLLVVLCLPATARSGGDCLTGTVTAVETPPNSGVWKYCMSLTYDVTSLASAPSHFSLIMGALADCPCVCRPDIITFESPAGSSPGTDQVTGDPCKVLYEGVYECEGDPTLPGFPGPAVKWEVPEGTCEPNLTGTGTFCFLSVLPPAPPSSTTVVIKLGQQECSGTVTGTLPSCSCPTPTRPGTWGRLKSLYR